MLSIKNVTKIYRTGGNQVVALDDVSIDFPEKGFVFLLGKSGSGKSTLLNVIGGLDSLNGGEIIIKGKSSKNFTQSDFDSYRNTFIGFIFQEYNILENFTVAKNLALAIELQGKKATKEKVNEILSKVEMLDYANRKPNQISGGQKQRVAIARALIKNPEIIMADEPTGALDSGTGKQVMDTLKELSKEKLVIVVSHDRDFAEIYGDRIIELKDGKIISDVTKKEIESTETDGGMKIIDDNIIFIQKGKVPSKEQFEQVYERIVQKSAEADTFISFDSDANKKLKEAAKITEDGNREKFLETTSEDIKLQNYNPNSLKLIKSRLKFVDSFKMGASSLKHKFWKLFITIILSIFAFTIFGVLDTLSCWNRAKSVYEGINITNQTNISFIKRKKVVDDDGDEYTRNVLSHDSDLMKLKSDFPSYSFRGVVSANSSMNFYINEFMVQLSMSQNPYYDMGVSGYLTVTVEELNNWNFSLIGRLPENENEVCISKHVFDNLVELTADSSVKVTSFDNLYVKLNINDYFDYGYNYDYYYYDYNNENNSNENDYRIKVVGIIDDNTDLSKLKGLNPESANDMTMMYFYSNLIEYGFTNLVYVTSEKYQDLYDNHYVRSSGYNNFLLHDNERDMKYWIDKNGLKKINDFYEEYITSNNYVNGSYIQNLSADEQFYWFNSTQIIYRKNGTNLYYDNGVKGLGKNEIILGEDLLNDLCGENWQERIDNGLVLGVCEDNYDGDLFYYTVVGATTYYNCVMSEETYNDKLKNIICGYEFVITKLSGTSQDRALIETLENYNGENIKFVIQNSATSILDTLENLILYTAKVFLYIGIAFAVFASTFFMNFISVSINYKKREIGVLRALGARGIDIFGIFLNESTIISLINSLISIVLTFVICLVANQMMVLKLGIQIVLLMPGIRQIILVFVISWLSACLSSFFPSRKISRKKPIDAINNR